MDIYQPTTDHVLRLPTVQSWPELQTLFTKAASRKPKHWRLPLQACKAVGGTVEQSIPAIAAIACAHVSILLLDDMLDEDPRGEYHQAGYAKAANYAAAFQAAALEAFSSSEMLPETKLLGLGILNQMLLMTSLGQHLDIQNPSDDIAYWHVVENKSAPFFGAAFCLGALIGGATKSVATALEQLGQIYGEMIQIHDDLNDTMSTPATSDWIQGRSPLPILFAQVVDHSERENFLALRRDISQPGALAKAQNILIHSGAISYCLDQLLHRHRVVQQNLNALSLPSKDILNGLVEEIIAPVHRLFQEVGIPISGSATRVEDQVLV